MSNTSTLVRVRIFRESNGNPCAMRNCGEDADVGRGLLCYEHSFRLSRYAASWVALRWRSYSDDPLDVKKCAQYDAAMRYAQAEMDALHTEYGATLPQRVREDRASAWRQEQGMITR